MSIKNRELDQLLKAARLPEREAGYWEGFPSEITRRLRQQAGPAAAADSAVRNRAPAEKRQWKFATLLWATGLATACIVAGFAIGFWKGKETSQETQLAAMQKYYRELAALFPKQLEAVVLESGQFHLQLSEHPDVPVSPPLFVRLCKTSKCAAVVTFSGQQIEILGRKFEVLVDGRGQIMLLGQDGVWTAGQAPVGGALRFEAGWLEQRL